MAYATPNLLPESASTFEGGTTTWVAGANTATPTVVTATAELLPGSAHAMRLTASAAGAVTATSPRFAVTAASQYMIRIPVRTSTAVAGRVFTATVTWYSAVSGGSSVGTTPQVINLSSSAAYVNTNYAAILVNAPAGALSATLTCNVTGLAAGAFVNVDDLFAGLAPVHAGNLLDFNVSSMEVSVSGWSVDNGTIVRTSGTVTEGAGYWCLLATSTAAGDMPLRPTASVAVTAGVEYVGRAALQSIAATSVIAEIRWYDTGGSQISAVQHTETFTAGAFGDVPVVGTAPAGAVTARLYIRPQATAAGQQFAVDDVMFMPAPNSPGNLLSYDEYSFEGSLPAWTTADGAIDRSSFVSSTTDGFFALGITPSAPGIITAYLDRLVPVAAGQTYHLSAVLVRRNSDTAQAISASATISVDWYDSSGALLLPGDFVAPEPFVSNSMYYYITTSFTSDAPAGAAFAKLSVVLDSTSPLIDKWFVDKVSINAATSDMTITVDNEAGLVTLDVFFVPPAEWAQDYVTIQRMDESGHASPMRGYGVSYDSVPYTPGPLVIEDYEAPLGTRVWYVLKWTADGTTDASYLSSSLIDTPVLADADYIWVKSPGNPALNLIAMMESPITWTRAARAAKYDIVGRKNPVSETDSRGGRQGAASLLIWDPAANDQFDALLDSGLPLLLQAMPGYGFSGNVYVSTGDSEAAPLSPNARDAGWRWTLPVTEIDRPVGGLQGSASITWQSIYDGYDTWQGVFDTHDTWTDVLIKG